MLGGRVKTLHPRIHAGILARRDQADDLAALDGARDRAVRPRRASTSTRSSEVAARHGVARGGRGRDDRHRRARDAPRGGEELRARRPGLPARADYEPVLEELRAPRRALARDPARARRATAFARTAAYEAAIAALVRRARGASPSCFMPAFEKVLDLAYGENPHQRAAYYAERARAHAPALAGRAAARASELSFNNLQRPRRPRGCSLASSTLPALRDRQAREPVRGRRRRARSRRPTTQRARRRPGLGLRRRRRPQPAGRRGARRAARRAVRRGAVRARLRRRRRSRRSRAKPSRRGSSTTASGARPTRRAGLQARARRAARPGPRLGRRGPRGDGASSAATPSEADVGRPALRLARLQARRVERDRAREGAADDRHRRGPDEPRRRGADRGREGARARPRRSRARRSPPTRSSRSPTARGSRSTRA